MSALQIAARPTIYAGIQMRSRLEARAAALFDAAGVPWQHEPYAFKSPSGEYLPDFVIGKRSQIYIEVKPFIFPSFRALETPMAVMQESGVKDFAVLFDNGWIFTLLGTLHSGWLYVCVLGKGHLNVDDELVPAGNCATCQSRTIRADEWLRQVKP